MAFALAITVVHAVRPTASYRALELGGGAAAVGVIAASYAVLSAVAAVPIGRWVDRLGTRRFLVGGTATLIAATVVSSASFSLWSLALSQSLLGLGQIAVAIGFQTVTAHQFADDRDRGFARLTVAASGGQLLGPALAGAILESSGGSHASFATTMVFATAGLLATLSFAGAWLLRDSVATKPDPADSGSEGGGAIDSLVAVVRRPGMPQALVTSIAVLTALDLMIAYLPVIGETRGIGPATIGLLLSLRATAGLACRLVMTRLLRVVSRRALLFSAMLASSLSMFGIAVSGRAWVLGLLVIVTGFGLGVGSPMTMAWVADRAPDTGRGTALAVRMTGNRVGQVVVPAIVGMLAGAFGPGTVFLVLAGTLATTSAWVRSSGLDMPHRTS